MYTFVKNPQLFRTFFRYLKPFILFRKSNSDEVEVKFRLELIQKVLTQGCWYILYIMGMNCICPSFALLGILLLANSKSSKVPKKCLNFCSWLALQSRKLRLWKLTRLMLSFGLVFEVFRFKHPPWLLLKSFLYASRTFYQSKRIVTRLTCVMFYITVFH